MALQKATKQKGVSASVSPVYSSKIIKAGALLADTKTLLAHWDVAISVHENVERLRRENVFGKASRSRVEDILANLSAAFPHGLVRDESPGRTGTGTISRRIVGPHPLLLCGPSRPIATRCRHRGLATIAGPRHHRHRRGGVEAATEEVGGRGQDQRPVVRPDHRARSHKGCCRPCGTSASCKGPSRSESPRRTCRSRRLPS